MSIYDKINYIIEPGGDSGHAITVYALTTCGFCRRAIAFLQEKNVAFKYVYIDELPPDTKAELKTELRDRYMRNLVFPFLVVDDKESATGFVQEKWKELLSLDGK